MIIPMIGYSHAFLKFFHGILDEFKGSCGHRSEYEIMKACIFRVNILDGPRDPLDTNKRGGWCILKTCYCRPRITCQCRGRGRARWVR